MPFAAVVCIQMALRVATVRGANRESVVVVDMAVGAGVDLADGRQLVRVRQRKTGSAVIESRVQERDGIVTIRAIGRGKSGAGG